MQAHQEAGGGFAHCPCKTDSAPLGDNNAVGAGGFRRPDDGTEVVGILYAVAEYDEGRFVLALGQGEYVVDACVFMHCGEGRYALMTAAAHSLQFGGGDLFDGDVHLPREGDNLTEGASAAVGGTRHKQRFNGSAAFQCFGDGIASGN